MENADLRELEAIAVILRSISPMVITYFNSFGQAPATYTYLFDKLVARLLLLYKTDPGIVAKALSATEESMLRIIRQAVEEEKAYKVPDTVDQALEQFAKSPVVKENKHKESDGDKLIDAYLESKKKSIKVKKST